MLSNVDWATIITKLLTSDVFYTTLLPIVIAWVGLQWNNIKQRTSIGNSLETLESRAHGLILAAFQLGEQLGWDGETRKTYVLERMRTLASALHLKMSTEDLENILDAIIESVYLTQKVDDYSPVGSPRNTGAEVAEEETDATE